MPSPATAQAAEPDLPADPIAALIASGDHREAIGRCADEHGALLTRVAMALLGARADADEAVQETLLQAYRSLGTYRGEAPVRAWLCGIARHVAIRMLETRRRGRLTPEVVPEPSSDQHDEFMRKQRAVHVRAAMAELKPTEREAVVLRFVADLSHKEIAAACQIDEAAARKRVSRGLANLRGLLKEEQRS